MRKLNHRADFTEGGGGAKLHLKRLFLGHCGKLYVSGQTYRHIFEDFESININGCPCWAQGKGHPELGSGSCQRYIIPTKEKINNITSTSYTAKRNVKGNLVPRRIAFTLAEVLITLGIIGIVAAMTLPTLISNIQDKEFRTMFKKQYSTISQALLMTFESGDDIQSLNQENWSDMIYYVCKIASQLKYVDAGLNCKEIEKLGNSSDFDNNPIYTNNITWHANYKWYNKQGTPQILNSGYWYMTFKLPDGAWINFNCLRDIFVDVNGAARPNTIGRDIYYFSIPVGSLRTSFFGRNQMVNRCSGNSGVSITPENYKSDCESGSGWGCSPLYILN